MVPATSRHVLVGASRLEHTTMENLNSTYVKVIVLEVAIVVLLWLLGRVYS